LGASFTFAVETRTEKMFTRRLQDLLGSRIPGGVDVVNAGVAGYGTAQELLLLRELREEHHIVPKLYVLVFFSNDILDNLCLSYGNLAPQPSRPCFQIDEHGQLVFNHLPQKMLDNRDDTLVAQGQ